MTRISHKKNPKKISASFFKYFPPLIKSVNRLDEFHNKRYHCKRQNNHTSVKNLCRSLETEAEEQDCITSLIMK